MLSRLRGSWLGTQVFSALSQRNLEGHTTLHHNPTVDAEHLTGNVICLR